MNDNVKPVTVAEHIMRGYDQLEKTCRQKIGCFPMPDTYSVEPVDIISLLTQFFSNAYETQDYMPTLKQYSKMKGITSDQLEAVYPDVQKYITDVLTIIKTRQV